MYQRDLAQASRHDRRVRGVAAFRGEDTLSNLDRLDVFRKGGRHGQDEIRVTPLLNCLLVCLYERIRREENAANCGAYRAGYSAVDPLKLLHRIQIQSGMQNLGQSAGLDGVDDVLFVDNAGAVQIQERLDLSLRTLVGNRVLVNDPQLVVLNGEANAPDLLEVFLKLAPNLLEGLV